jgi:chaperonin cofactor prefoldin
MQLLEFCSSSQKFCLFKISELTMNRVVIGVGILSLSLGSFLIGCDNATQARMDVGKRKILEQIDNTIGKMEVQKADIDRNLKTAKLAVGDLRKAKIKAQVSLEQLDEKVRPFQDSIEKIDESLVKLRDAIKADMPATYNGKTYSVLHPHRHIGEHSSLRNNTLFVNLKSDLALQDIETFVLTTVYMRGWTTARRHDSFPCRILAIRLITRCKESVNITDDRNGSS